MSTRLLQRQILPLDRDFDVLPLYIDAEAASLDADKYEVGANRHAREMNAVSMRQNVSSGHHIHPDQIESRTRLRIPQGERLSFGTYFNAFPASYWRRWTVVTDVTLTVKLSGLGASVTVYKSMANGRSQRVDSASTGSDGSASFAFELSLKPFVDGGWYWYNVVAGDEDVVVESAEWTAEVPEDRAAHGTVDLAITTMNRPDFCAKLLTQIGEDEQLRPYLDTVFVMEQGTQKVVDSPEFAKAEGSLGPLLRVIEQGNLGGSGGYARGQLESVRKGTATYAMMMDDDVVCEPEGILRAITFGDLARRPTIVGGHMFSLYSRSRLHSFGEIIQPWRFWWQSPPGVLQRLGLRRPQPALGPLAARARGRRLQRLVHVPDPARGPGGDRAVAAALHQVGRLRVRPARQGGRLPDGDVPRRRRLARPVDRQERRARLAGLLPPAQPLRRGAAALAVPQAAAGWSGRASTTRSSTWSRCSTPPSSCGTRRSRTSWPGPTGCTPTCRRSSRRSTRSASSSPTPGSRPTPTPSRRYAARSRRARARDGTEIPGRLSQLMTAGTGSARGSCARPATSRASTPRRRSPRWTRSGTAWRATTPRSSR